MTALSSIMKQRRFFNMYFTTTISVSLVLFLIGLESLVLMSARNLIRHVRENVVLTVVMSEEASPEEVEHMKSLIDTYPFVLESKYISREQALQEHIETLGEDPEKFLGYNPLTDAFELRLQETYTQTDSIQAIDNKISALTYVDKVIYHADIVNTLNDNVNKVVLILLVAALALLVIALLLIANTIQLQIYSKRFIINTMCLVGATPWVVKWPFVRRNLWLGVEASVIACGLLALVYYYCLNRFGLQLFPLTHFTVGSIVGLVFISGFVITFVASLIATNRYIRMKTGKLYEI
jgi:cell division transport system permease protein